MRVGLEPIYEGRKIFRDRRGSGEKNFEERIDWYVIHNTSPVEGHKDRWGTKGRHGK